MECRTTTRANLPGKISCTIGNLKSPAPDPITKQHGQEEVGREGASGPVEGPCQAGRSRLQRGSCNRVRSANRQACTFPLCRNGDRSRRPATGRNYTAGPVGTTEISHTDPQTHLTPSVGSSHPRLEHKELGTPSPSDEEARTHPPFRWRRLSLQPRALPCRALRMPRAGFGESEVSRETPLGEVRRPVAQPRRDCGVASPTTASRAAWAFSDSESSRATYAINM